MDRVRIVPDENIGKNFIPAEYLPKGKDEYHLRNKQNTKPASGWRNLRPEEIAELIKNHNAADDWNAVLVTDPFDTNLIQNSAFHGLVRIGSMRNVILQQGNLKVPVGISNSLIISCDIGDDAAIHNTRYLSHYIIGAHCILFNIDEMHTTDHAKFGNGILKEGETESERTWLELMNESGGRSVLPFESMTTADAFLWAKYRDDAVLQEKLIALTQQSMDHQRGYYGTIENQCIIKNARTLIDVKTGSHCCISGINRLENLTILSSETEPTQVGEGVELIHGIVGYGCNVLHGCKAVRFILGNHVCLKYGARLLNTILGDNSTIACCEVQHNLIFPAHEQHHNNSFLIASVIMGQSNIAAGATIGSNHNSRSNDNEIQAGRGFWPGLCTSFKHSSRFASFTLIAKADYPVELNILLPFSLVNNNTTKNQLEVMPAFWWLYNMYALTRNSQKFHARDQRICKTQHIEFETFAPDTVEEILQAMRLLEIWTAKAFLKGQQESLVTHNEETLIIKGRQILTGNPQTAGQLEVVGEHMENSKRRTLILKPYQAYHAYRDMLFYYAGKNILDHLEAHPDTSALSIQEALIGNHVREWVNLGGQLMQKQDLDKLRSDICDQKLSTWKSVHNRYDKLWKRYPLDKQKHAFAVLCLLLNQNQLKTSDWASFLDKLATVGEYINEQVLTSREKDHKNPFQQITFRNQEEMAATIGTVEENDFIIQVKREITDFIKQIENLKKTWFNR